MWLISVGHNLHLGWTCYLYRFGVGVGVELAIESAFECFYHWAKSRNWHCHPQQSHYYIVQKNCFVTHTDHKSYKLYAPWIPQFLNAIVCGFCMTCDCIIETRSYWEQYYTRHTQIRKCAYVPLTVTLNADYYEVRHFCRCLIFAIFVNLRLHKITNNGKVLTKL